MLLPRGPHIGGGDDAVVLESCRSRGCARAPARERSRSFGVSLSLSLFLSFFARAVFLALTRATTDSFPISSSYSVRGLTSLDVRFSHLCRVLSVSLSFSHALLSVSNLESGGGHSGLRDLRTSASSRHARPDRRVIRPYSLAFTRREPRARFLTSLSRFARPDLRICGDDAGLMRRAHARSVRFDFLGTTTRTDVSERGLRDPSGGDDEHAYDARTLGLASARFGAMHDTDRRTALLSTLCSSSSPCLSLFLSLSSSLTISLSHDAHTLLHSYSLGEYNAHPRHGGCREARATVRGPSWVCSRRRRDGCGDGSDGSDDRDDRDDDGDRASYCVPRIVSRTRKILARYGAFGPGLSTHSGIFAHL